MTLTFEDFPVGRLGTFGPRRVQFGKLLFRNEVHRPDPLAFGGEPFERRGFFVGVARLVGVERELLRQPLRHHLKLVDRLAREFGAARLLSFRARRGGRP